MCCQAALAGAPAVWNPRPQTDALPFMQYCGGCAEQPPVTRAIGRRLPPNRHRITAACRLCTVIMLRERPFVSRDQAFAGAIPAAHDSMRIFLFAGLQLASGGRRFLVT
jgi:hypothetical protein